MQILIILLFVPLSFSQTLQTTKEKVRAIADGILQDSVFQFVDVNSGKIYSSTAKIPNDAKLKLLSPYNDWRYWNGVINIAMLKLSSVLADTAYSNFAKKNVAFGFDSYKYFQSKYNNEGKWNYTFGQFFEISELDDCGAIGASIIEVYKSNKENRYKEYIDKSANHILKKQDRLADGTLVRHFPQKFTLWADDLYMGLSFLTRMGELTSEEKYFDDAVLQVINYHKYLFDERVGAMSHFWYSDVNRRGTAFWGRSNGWALVAQVDLLDRLPKNHAQRDTLIKLLQRHIIGISRYQSATGLWHQLLDKTDSYLETSCSAMFTYAIARAVRGGYIEPRYSSIAERGWEGVMTKILPDGQVEGVCAGTVTSDDLVHYYNRPAPLNDIHGIGTVLLAGAEMILYLEKRN